MPDEAMLKKEHEAQTFDPIAEWEKIEASVREELKAAGHENNWDEKINLEHKHFDVLEEKFVGRGVDSYHEIFSRLRAVHRADWALERIQRINSGFHEGFEIGEMMDKRTLVEFIATCDYYHDGLTSRRNYGEINNRWVSTDPVECLSVGSALTALATKEGFHVGSNLVDLGGGNGVWAILSKIGFNVTLIERDKKLVEQYWIERKRLEKMGIKSGNVRTIQGEFHPEPSENTTEIKNALESADVMVCYPWPSETEDRLELFRAHGKQDSLLVLYGGPMDDLRLDVDWLAKYGLEVIGEEINRRLKERDEDPDFRGYYGIRGFETPSFGANWIVLRKKPTEK